MFQHTELYLSFSKSQPRLSLFLKFREFQPRYSYKIYSYKKKIVLLLAELRAHCFELEIIAH